MNDGRWAGLSPEEMRRRAEVRVEEKDTTDLADLAEKDKDALIHELRVHQVELEIQNEELRHAQDTLEKNRDEYLNLYNHAPVGYLTVSEKGIIRRHNETFLEMIGDLERDLRDRHFSSLLSEESGKQFLARFRSFFSQPREKNLEVQLRLIGSPIEQYRDIRLTGRKTFCLAETGEPCLLLAVTDITEQKESERKIRTLLDDKDTLMREIHHRVKNNLNLVISMLNLQVQRVPDAAETGAIQKAIERVRTMYSIYEMLQGTQDYQMVDLQEYLGVLLNRIADGEADEDAPILNKSLSPVRVPVRQAVSLGIVLNELVADALEHAFTGTDRDGPERLVDVTLRTIDGGRVQLTVCDNGVGMADGAAVQDPAGGGLGLLFVRSQVEQWGGTFDIQPADPGMRFVVVFAPADPDGD